MHPMISIGIAMKSHSSSFLFLSLFVGLIQIASAAGDTIVDWKHNAQTDPAAARATLLANTPGTVPGLDPAFLEAAESAYRLASRDAAGITGYEGYRAALERFVNVFQDDHLWMDFVDPPTRKWPGF